MSRSPFFVIFLVAASRKAQAEDWLERRGEGSGNLTVEIIRKTDPDNAPAVAYAGFAWVDANLRSDLAAKAAQLGSDAKLFWATNRKSAREKAIAKLDQWGYRVKPRG